MGGRVGAGEGVGMGSRSRMRLNADEAVSAQLVIPVTPTAGPRDINLRLQIYILTPRPGPLNANGQRHNWPGQPAITYFMIT